MPRPSLPRRVWAAVWPALVWLWAQILAWMNEPVLWPKLHEPEPEPERTLRLYRPPMRVREPEHVGRHRVTA